MICPLCCCDMNSTSTSVEHYQCRVAYEKGRNESKDLLAYSQKRHAEIYSELTRLREAIEKAIKILPHTRGYCDTLAGLPCDCHVRDLDTHLRDALKEGK